MSSAELEGKRRVNVLYNCEIIKGRELLGLVSEVE